MEVLPGVTQGVTSTLRRGVPCHWGYESAGSRPRYPVPKGGGGDELAALGRRCRLPTSRSATKMTTIAPGASPTSGYLLEAAETDEIDHSASFMVGDR